MQLQSVREELHTAVGVSGSVSGMSRQWRMTVADDRQKWAELPQRQLVVRTEGLLLKKLVVVVAAAEIVSFSITLKVFSEIIIYSKKISSNLSNLK